jgi:hypothetical protein
VAAYAIGSWRPILSAEAGWKEPSMPFYALVDPVTGEPVEVVQDLDRPIPEGLIVIELPAPRDRVSLAAPGVHDRGGGAEGREVQTEHDADPHAGRASTPQSKDHTAEQFFGRVERELTRAKKSGEHFSVLLFDLAPMDRSRAEELVKEILHECKHDLVAGDFMALLREHLTGVLVRDVNARGARILLPRGEVTIITFPEDGKAIESLLNRRHPLLRGSRHETDAA